MNEPPIMEHRFHVRAHDLDAGGMASPVALIRLLENQRWHAFAAEGMLGAFFESGVIRAQRLQLYRALSFDDEITIAMWLSRVGRTSLELGHTLCAGGETVGRAVVAAVATDREGRPTPLTEEVRRLLSDRETMALPRLELLPPEGAWSHGFTVRASDIDLLGHVNEARHVDYVDDTRRACALAGGYGEQSRRAAFPLRSLVISYEGQPHLGDRLRAVTWISSEGDSLYDVEVRREPDGELMTLARLEVAG
jgi:acyl-CoA thioesterase FadM